MLKNKKWIGLSLVAISSSCMAVEYTLGRYSVIIDRSPFGSDPLVADAINENRQQEAANKAAAEAAKDFRLCFLLEDQSGEIRAGFENKKAKPGEPRSVILMVGESFMGMKLLSVDLAKSQATLQNRGKPIQFTLTKSTTVAAAPKAAPAAASRRRFGAGFRKKEPVEELPKLTPEEERQRRKEVRESMQAYQMEVIRAGMPPLPIPLTQEMDDQLVSEGVLPPSD